MASHPAKTSVIVASWLAVAGSVSCDRGGDVTHFRVPKRTAPAPGAVAPASMAGDVPAPPSPGKGGALRWTLPKGWGESMGGQMRFATLTPPVPGKVDASVVVLSGDAGGELANVNRWRNQIGLPPIDGAELGRARRAVTTKAGPVSVYDFSSGGDGGNRVVAGLLLGQGDAWFVKLTGDAAAVAAARDDFMQIIGSLRFDESR